MLLSVCRFDVPEFLSRLDQAGIRVVFLPPYSPQFNPIEHVYSKVKSFMRSNLRALQMLGWTPYRIILASFQSVTPADCLGYVASCGYAVG